MADIIKPLFLTEKILCISLFFQYLELYALRRSFNDTGIWRWKDLRLDFCFCPKVVQKFLDFFLNYSVYIFIIVFSILSSILLLGSGLFYPTLKVSSALLAILLLSTWLTCVRWRGSFHGGSDYMGIVLLQALLVSSLVPTDSPIFLGCIWYIAIQSTSSYLVAGWVKLTNKDWRSGKALYHFIHSSSYACPQRLKQYSTQTSCQILSIFIIIFEISFPLCFLHRSLAMVYLSLGLWLPFRKCLRIWIESLLFYLGGELPSDFLFGEMISIEGHKFLAP